MEGIAAFIGSIGDAYDNALAESAIGLFNTEVMAKNNPFHAGPYKSIEDVEYATMEWVDWFNRSRLHSRLEYLTPDEFEAAYYGWAIDSPTGAVTAVGAGKNPSRFSPDPPSLICV